MIDVRGRLTDPDLPATVRRLGFRDRDVEDVLTAAASVAHTPSDVARIEGWARRLRANLGAFSRAQPDDPWAGAAQEDGGRGIGVLELLTLLVTAEDVRDYHRSRGIADDISWQSLSDLGQQAWVHRRTYGAFGLHTYRWLSLAWSGALYWLGRLQFDLELDGEDWVLSTHIPESGPLTPASVDDSFRRATGFFARHFPDYPTTDFLCASWLLDPALAAVLSPQSNLARFQRRWNRYGEAMSGDADALFFTFSRRGDVDLTQLPRETTLQRAILERLESGGHWSLWRGRITQPGAIQARTRVCG